MRVAQNISFLTWIRAAHSVERRDRRAALPFAPGRAGRILVINYRRLVRVDVSLNWRAASRAAGRAAGRCGEGPVNGVPALSHTARCAPQRKSRCALCDVVDQGSRFTCIKQLFGKCIVGVPPSLASLLLRSNPSLSSQPFPAETGEKPHWKGNIYSDVPLFSRDERFFRTQTIFPFFPS